jgi:hypothetical protein
MIHERVARARRFQDYLDSQWLALSRVDGLAFDWGLVSGLLTRDLERLAEPYERAVGLPARPGDRDLVEAAPVGVPAQPGAPG